MISVVILTKNEEINIADCISSVDWCDDVVVLDSFSTDHTVQIATEMGARITKRKFDDFAAQRNFALDSIEFNYDWIFCLDADERFTEQLYKECREVVGHDLCSGYLVPSKMIFLGKWLRWAATYPVYQLRFLKHGELRFVQIGHGQQEGKAHRGIGKLQSPYLHYNFSKGFEDWLYRHNLYSTSEALEAWQSRNNGSNHLRKVFSNNIVERRRALRQFSFHLPCRPLLRFVYMYLWRFGLLDGRRGLTYCLMLTMYEYMISVKLKELERQEKRVGPSLNNS